MDLSQTKVKSGGKYNKSRLKRGKLGKIKLNRSYTESNEEYERPPEPCVDPLSSSELEDAVSGDGGSDTECTSTHSDMNISLSDIKKNLKRTAPKEHSSTGRKAKPGKSKSAEATSEFARSTRNQKKSYPNETLHFCVECDYSTSRRSSFKKHLLIHSGKKPYSCKQCVYTCNQIGHLKQHVLIHSDEKPYSCSECVYTCRYISNLKQHALTHSAEAPFSCDVCDYTCRRADNLRRHSLIHSDKMSHHCEECDFACRRAGLLKQHALIHSSETTYTCSKCDYRCRRTDNLKRHLLTHAGEKTK